MRRNKIESEWDNLQAKISAESEQDVKVFQLEHKGKKHDVLVDAEDWPLLSRYHWMVKPCKRTSYVYTVYKYGPDKKQISVSLHRMILGMPKLEIDHKNNNGLDNRKINLRLCSRSQNMANKRAKNKYGYRGICKIGNSYSAQIRYKGKNIVKHGFKTPKEAARCYDEMSRKYQGVFGVRNFGE